MQTWPFFSSLALLRTLSPLAAQFPSGPAHQVEKLTAPSAEAVDAVNSWLSRNNVTSTPGATSQWLNIKVPVATANALLDADFQTYSNADTGTTAVRTLAYSVPKSVKPFLDFIYPATA